MKVNVKFNKYNKINKKNMIININPSKKIINTKKYFWENNNPINWVSILIPSYNTNKYFLISCINSIKYQTGNFGLEIIWIDDGSIDNHSKILCQLLDSIIKPLNNCKLKYIKLNENKGISFCLNYGVNLCSYEIIFRMDSDDIMKYDRIEKQLNYMNLNKSCIMCGTNIKLFKISNEKIEYINDSNHKHILTWEEYKKNPTDWILNHPTLCFRKTNILKIGNYNKDITYPFEDLELELRVLKTYGTLINLNECLLFYRVHNNQTSKNDLTEYKTLKDELIQTIINS